MIKAEIPEKPEVEKGKPEEGKEAGEEVAEGEEGKPRRRRVTISIEAPDGRLADISRGVIKPLKDEGADVKVEVSIEAKGEISEHTLKMKVKETLQQLGTKFKLEEND